MERIIFLTILSLASAGRVRRAGDHHGDGHDDNCVDISQYGPVQYNESSTEICSYKLSTTCTEQSREICVSVPIFQCHVIGYTRCEDIPTTQKVREDSMENENFIPQSCVISNEKKVLSEVKKMPVCKTVSKQQCDSKWVINEQGEKVWAGNENCEEVTWEDCTLEDKIVTQEVDVWECTPGEPIEYQTAIINTDTATTTDRVCQPIADQVCNIIRREDMCTTIEWDECVDTVTPNCFTSYFKTPYQEYDHRLRCSVGH